MNLDIFVNYIINDNNVNGNGKIIILDKDISLIKLQKYLCKGINNCFLFVDNKYDNYFDNIVFLLYNKNIYGIIKQKINTFYIWKVKI
jgi:hypothetical protein